MREEEQNFIKEYGDGYWHKLLKNYFFVFSLPKGALIREKEKEKATTAVRGHTCAGAHVQNNNNKNETKFLFWAVGKTTCHLCAWFSLFHVYTMGRSYYSIDFPRWSQF